MARRIRRITAVLISCSLLFIAGAFLASAAPANTPAREDAQLGAAPALEMAATTITVNSMADYASDGKSKTCLNATPCTLRRAINQAYSLTAGQRPVTIAFNIPTSDPGYINTAQVPGAWKITLDGQPSLDELRELYGKTTVDGTTQPGGRANGPKIIIDGQGNKNNGFIMRNGDNVVRGVQMQRFRTTHITISSSNNVVENSWFGLSDNGFTLSSGNDVTPEGGSGVALSAGSNNNTIRNNVMTGFFGVAAAIRGNNNVFTGNRIGTRVNGMVPLPAQFQTHPCSAGAWVGGSGITVADANNQIGGPAAANGNLFAGLFLAISATSTQRPAMDVGGQGHTIQNNIIGLDINQTVIGVCGRGLDFGNGPRDMRVTGNTIVNTGLSAVLLNGNSANGNTLRSNVIQQESAWPGVQPGNAFPEGAIVFGPFTPTALRNFRPAQVTSVAGVMVSGVAGAGSPCGGCTIEVFLDDTDSVTETLRSLAVATSAANGNWSATLPAPLQPGQGLRTTSTVPDTFTIVGLNAGTTSNLSTLQAVQGRRAYLPMAMRRR